MLLDFWIVYTLIKPFKDINKFNRMRLDVPALKKKSILQKKKKEIVECEQEKQKVEDSKHIYV